MLSKFASLFVSIASRAFDRLRLIFGIAGKDEGRVSSTPTPWLATYPLSHSERAG
jgi:hypothetical protein